VGNPPFSDRTVRADDAAGRLGLSLHDYFIARSIERLKPGGLAGRWCTWRLEVEMAPALNCYAMTGWRRTESGRPAANIRFSTATPTAASVCWAAKPRARRRGPISAL